MIILDASVLSLVIGHRGPAGDGARTRVAAEQDVGAPDLINLETASALRTWWRRGDLDDRQFLHAIEQLRRFPLHRIPTVDLLPRLAQLRHNVTPYDASYIALAEQLGCLLLTTDGRLANAHGPRCDIELLPT